MGILVLMHRMKLAVSVGLFFLVLTFISGRASPTYAQLSDKDAYCIRVFQKINQEIRWGYVRPQTRERVIQYFYDQKIPAQDRAKKIFAAVVSDRIKLLPKKEAKAVQKFLLKNVYLDYQESGSPAFAGFFNESPPNKKEIVLSLPVDLRDTIIEYTMLTHELEHYIQSLAIARKPITRHKSTAELITHFVDFTYEKEVGAMLSEFEYLNVIPQEERKKLVQSVTAHPELFEPDTQELIINLLDHGSTTPMEHVEFQHQKGRYDRDSLIRNNYDSFWLGALIFLSGSTDSMAVEAIGQQVSQIKKVCKELTEQKKNRSRSAESVDKKRDLLPFCSHVRSSS